VETSQGKILGRMLDRLFAGLVSGPNLNCRPHSSRQRLDFMQLGKLQDLAAETALLELFAKAEVKLAGRAVMPKRPRKPVERGASRAQTAENEADALTPEEKAVQETWAQQQAVLSKLRILAEEARTYRQDTGVHVLNIGLPLLSLPPGALGKSGARGGGKRVLAPIAFLPVEISLRTGASPTVQIVCQKDGEDVVLPNLALFAWLEQQTGQAVNEAILDEIGPGRWEQVRNLVRHAAQLMNLPVPEFLRDEAGQADADAKAKARHWDLKAAPRGDDDDKPAIVTAAVLGLFPMHNQGLLRDTRAMLEEKPQGPIESFLRADVSLDEPADFSYEHDSWSGQKRIRCFADERLVTLADPCQARAVRLARDCRGLVVHGPPGTGKSQTITNIIGDHLARGQRVLMVCDKRTALDVVANRLEHLGLGGLVAVIHDPRHDQRDLYRKLRDQLESLTDARTDSRANGKLAKTDDELQRLHDGLAEYWKLLMARDAASGTSFHELVGQWLDAPAPAGLDTDGLAPQGANLTEFEQHEANVRDILERADQTGHNGWAQAAGIALPDFLARPMNQVRQTMQECAERARQADAGGDPSLPPLSCKAPLAGQAEARSRLAEQIERVVKCLSREDLARWTKADSKALRRARNKLAQAAPLIKGVQAGPLDAELALLTGERSQAQISRDLGALESYLEVAGEWYGFIYFRRRTEAGRVLRDFGLPPNTASARRLRDFLKALRARLTLNALVAELRGNGRSKSAPLEDEALLSLLDGHEVLLDVLESVQIDPARDGLLPAVTQELENATTALPTALRRSASWAGALAALEKSLSGSGLFAPSWLEQVKKGWYAGKPCTADVLPLADKIDTLESVLRMRHGLGQLPAWLRSCAESVLSRCLEATTALAACRKAVLSAEIRDRLRNHPHFQTFDPHRLQSHFERYRTLEQDKQTLVRDNILHHWITRQQQRLLVGTGSRLNSQGADLRRRLTMRGEQALRLRQVITVGEKIDGGDPLFDLCPAWLASPETVAQVFPRRPLFDVVIFDEASQCRLEEALPVLTRAGRVVIAGTRFTWSRRSRQAPIAPCRRCWRARSPAAAGCCSPISPTPNRWPRPTKQRITRSPTAPARRKPASTSRPARPPRRSPPPWPAPSPSGTTSAAPSTGATRASASTWPCTIPAAARTSRSASFATASASPRPKTPWNGTSSAPASSNARAGVCTACGAPISSAIPTATPGSFSVR